MSPSDSPNLGGMYAAWADIVIKEWINKISLLGIEGTQLIASFTNHIAWAADGNAEKIVFAFEYYGKFTDMGVGNGVNVENRDVLIAAGLTRRRPKPWYTDTFYKQVARLRHLISERLAQQTQLMIVRNIQDGNGQIMEL